MLESIHLVNFQSHRDSLLTLDPRLTSIVGDSDAGKSAFIRALGWVAMNEPSGDFATHGEKLCSVTVKIDGRTIEKRRKGGSTFYILDGDESAPFKGVDPPKEIRDIFNVRSINFQSQMDGPFWLSESPPEVAKQIQTIVDLSAISVVLSRAKSDYNSAKSRHKTAIANLEGAITKADQLPDYTTPLSQLEVLEVLEDAAYSAEEKTKTFKEQSDAFLGITRQASAASRVQESLQQLRDAAEANVEAHRKSRNLEAMRLSFVGIRTKSVEYDADGHAALKRLITVQRSMREAERAQKGLSALLSRFQDVNSLLAQSQAEERNIAKRQKGICPTCGQPKR